MEVLNLAAVPVGFLAQCLVVIEHGRVGVEGGCVVVLTG